MEIKVTPPALGNKYWWMPTNGRHPITIQVVKLIAGQIEFNLVEERLGCWSASRSQSGRVTWTGKEWDAAVAASQLCDWVPPVTEKDLAPDERLCVSCRGTRWEATRDSDTIPCGWCNMDGKTNKPPEPKPSHTQRSPLHPRVPIDE